MPERLAPANGPWITRKLLLWCFLLMVLLPATIMTGLNLALYSNRQQAMVIAANRQCYIVFERQAPGQGRKTRDYWYADAPVVMSCAAVRAEYDRTRAITWMDNGEHVRLSRTGEVTDYTLATDFEGAAIERTARRFDADRADFDGQDKVWIRRLEWSGQDIVVIDGQGFVLRPLMWFALGALGFFLFWLGACVVARNSRPTGHSAS